MNRKQRQIVIEAFRMIRLRAEEGEKMARELVAQDLGPSEGSRTVAILAVKAYAETTARAAASLAKFLDDHLGATAVLDLVKYPRAKVLSSSGAPRPDAPNSRRRARPAP